MKKLLSYSCAILLSATLLISCKDEEGGTERVEFDQAAMLENYGNELIYPAYVDLNNWAATLETAVQTFNEQPNLINLLAAQQTLQQARLSWQRASMFEFGPAQQAELRKHINTFPSIRSQIEASIQGGTWDFSKLYAEDEKGFPALDYLLHGEESNEDAVLASFTSEANAESRRNYLKAVVQDISSRVKGVWEAWDPAKGNYLTTFNSNTGNGAGNSLSLLVNNMVFDFEIIKNQKIRNPLGLMTENKQPTPRNLEAYYSSESLELLKANLEGFEAVYRGNRDSQASAPGLEEFLAAHFHAGNTEENFAETINARLAEAKVAVNAIPAPLREALLSHPTEVTEAYNKLQALVPVIKVNLPNTLDVKITYTDTDGD